MSAAYDPSVIRRRDGTEIHLDDILTVEQGEAILAELDGAALQIEAQLAFGADPCRNRDAGWRIRAEMALKRKRRHLPRLQHRIGVLRRAERTRTGGAVAKIYAGTVDGKRGAFVKATYELLGQPFDLLKKKGKGSHYTVLVGNKTTTLQSGEYTPLMVRRILAQLGIDPASM